MASFIVFLASTCSAATFSPFFPALVSSAFLALVSLTNLLRSILDFLRTLIFLTMTWDNGKIFFPLSSNFWDTSSLIQFWANSETELFEALLAMYLTNAFLMALVWECLA